MFVSTHGITARPTSSAYGTLTTAWIAATGETDLTILGALNTLESDLTTYGLTAKMKALYPMVGGTAGKHSYNFMNTAQYQITWSGGLTHSSTGVLPNGTNGWGNMNFPLYATGGTGVTPQDNHVSFYSRTNLAGRDDIWLSTNSNQFLGLIVRYIANNDAYYGNINYYQTPNANGTGFYTGKSVGTAGKLFKNGSSILTATISSTFYSGSSMMNQGLFLGSTGYGNKECAFASVGLGLSDTEAANFYTAVQTFQTTLSRQVI
jgi:hypothetical protein